MNMNYENYISFIIFSAFLLNYIVANPTPNCPQSCLCNLTQSALTISSCSQIQTVFVLSLNQSQTVTSVSAVNCSIQSISFINCQLSNLLSVDLSYNQISSLTSSTFNCLKNVESIRLNNNNISSIDSNSFNNLTNLKFLYLSNNRINQIPQYLFYTHLSSLRTIDLSFNFLTEMELWPTYLPQIIYINLKNNFIQKFTNNFNWYLSASSNLSALSSTATVDLQYNNITSLDDKSIQQYGVCSFENYSSFITKYFYVFLLNNNPVTCNCINSQRLVTDSIRLLMSSTGLITSSLYLSYCAQPSSYAGKHLINFDTCQSGSNYPYCVNSTVTNTITTSATLSAGATSTASTTVMQTTKKSMSGNPIITSSHLSIVMCTLAILKI